MIEITYYRKYHRITITGHSGSAPEGEDLICAWITGHSYGIAENIQCMWHAGYCYDPILRTEKGDAELSCKVRKKYRDIVTAVLDALAVDFELAANMYPEYVHYEIHA